MRVFLGAALGALLLLGGCGAGLGLPLFGGGSRGVEAFQFEESHVPVGITYHYLKSNLDGSKPERVSIYVVNRDTIETFKFREPNPTFGAHVTATMDWERLSATRLESTQMSRGGQERKIAVAEYLPGRLSIELSDSTKQAIPIPHLPFHVYSFDFASLSMALRHLVNPVQPFTIGIASPTYADRGPVFEYRGEATFTYAGPETREGKPCLKYRVAGKGVKDHGGWVWTDKLEGHIVALEIEQPNHPDFESFKLKLMFTDTMKPDEWRTFMKSRLEGEAAE